MGFIRDLTGKTQADAVAEGTQQQLQAGQQAIGTLQAGAGRAQEFLSPFASLGQQGLEQAGFLTDPQAQFNFLQSNPLFQAALASGQEDTLQQAAARGRISSGDTQQQLAQNTLLAAAPLIDRQTSNIFNLLRGGQGLATSQAEIEQGLGSNIANLQTGLGATQAAGTIGAANVRGQRAGNLLNLAGQIGSQFAGGGLPFSPPPSRVI